MKGHYLASPRRLDFPELPIGRDRELRILENHFRIAQAGGGRCVLVKGGPGSGKTVTVNCFARYVRGQGGIFICGKYDQYRNDPYHAIQDGINQLGSILLMHDRPEFEKRKKRIECRLGADAEILTTFADEWAKVIDDVAEASLSHPPERRTILISIIRMLIGEFSSKRCPLVFFLDDLQWMDEGSSSVLRELLAQTIPPHSLFVGAFREQEIDESSSFWRDVLSSDRKSGTITSLITISPLDSDAVSDFIEKTLGLEGEELRSFSALTEQMTGGNPLQIRELLQTFHREGVLVPSGGGWVFHQEAMSKTVPDSTDNLYRERLQTVRSELKEILTVAAAIGGGFSVFNTAVAAGKPEREVLALFQEGVDTGLIVPMQVGCVWESSSSRYRFVHDTLRQTFYSLLPVHRRSHFHLSIARRFEAACDERKDSKLFGLAFHYNKATGLMHSMEDLYKLLVLNYSASKAALHATAWEQAFEYASTGIAILEKSDWNVAYETALSLMNTGIEAAYLSAHYETMETWIGYVESEARTTVDMAFAWRVRVQSLVARRSFQEALETGLAYCRELGEPVRTHPFFIRLFWNRFRSRFLFRRTCSARLSKERRPPGPRVQAIVDILTVSSSTAYLTNQHVFAAVAAAIYRNTIAKRIAYSNGFGCICFAIMLVRLKRYRQAFQLAQKGIRLAEHSPYAAELAKSYAYAAILVLHWKQHIKDTAVVFKKGYETGYRSGSFENASYCLSVMCFYNVFAAIIPLSEVEKEIGESLVLMEELRQERNKAVLSAHRQMLRCIRGKTYDISTFDDETFREAGHIERAEKTGDNSHLATFYCAKMFCAVLFGDYNQAGEYAGSIKPILFHISEQFHCSIFYYLYGLTLIILHRNELRGRVRSEVNQCVRLLSIFAEACPVNFEHRKELLLAELARSDGHVEDALRLYMSALDGARENGSFYDRGLINERIANYFEQLGMRAAATAYLKAARSCYFDWDAQAKVLQLERNHPEIADVERTHESQALNGSSADESQSAVISTSQAISQERFIGSILERFVRIIIQSSGAEKAVFLELAENRMTPRIAAQIDSESITTHIINEPIGRIHYPIGVVLYTERTGEPVIYAGNQDEQFLFDPYIGERKPASVLCIPVRVYRRIQAILYLEGDDECEEWDRDTVNLVESLATQAALSMESAHRFEREKQLEKTNKEQLLRLMEAEKLASIGFLIAEVAHEVSNPNQAISLHADNLTETCEDIISVLDELNDEEPLCIGNLEYPSFRREYAQMIKAIRVSSDQINALVQELRDFMKPRDTFDMADIDINGVIDSTILIAAHFIRKVTDHFHVEKGTVPVVTGDRQKLQQVLLNLIRNSCHSLTSRSAALWIRSSYDTDEETIVVTVEDQGCGMTPAQLENVCEPFFTSRHKDGGMGLGLYVSQSIVKEHGGELRIMSEEGKGTKVSIVLPVPEAQPIRSPESIPPAYRTGSLGSRQL